MGALQCNSLGEFHLILQTGETLPDSRLLLQMIYVYSGEGVPNRCSS